MKKNILYVLLLLGLTTSCMEKEVKYDINNLQKVELYYTIGDTLYPWVILLEDLDDYDDYLIDFRREKYLGFSGGRDRKYLDNHQDLYIIDTIYDYSQPLVKLLRPKTYVGYTPGIGYSMVDAIGYAPLYTVQVEDFCEFRDQHRGKDTLYTYPK